MNLSFLPQLIYKKKMENIIQREKNRPRGGKNKRKERAKKKQVEDAVRAIKTMGIEK